LINLDPHNGADFSIGTHRGQGPALRRTEFNLTSLLIGYTPILIVLDATPNPKLTQLEPWLLENRCPYFRKIQIFQLVAAIGLTADLRASRTDFFPIGRSMMANSNARLMVK
jgi:hypothetical protein